MKERTANFEVVEDAPTHLIIRDLGPWEIFPTITNSAEEVVAKLAPELKGRRLYYIDSEGDTDELVVENGRFKAFAPGPRR